MAKPPSSINRAKFNRIKDKFEAFLTERGAGVLRPTSEWELCRFTHGDALGIIYTNKRGNLSWMGGSGHVFACYLQALPWRAAPATQRRSKSSPICRTLRQRDGSLCFYCHQHVLPEEESPEHLLALTHGGPDHIANMVLTHGACNRAAGHLSLMEKIKIREKRARMPSNTRKLELVPMTEAVEACHAIEHKVMAVPAALVTADEIDRSTPWDTK